MKGFRATAIDVAKLAGVSQPTVSRVFSKPDSVSIEKVLRVRQAANELGYIPNFVARSLNSGRSRRIGIVLAYLKNSFFSEALHGLTMALNEKGYSATVFFARNDESEVDGIVQNLLADQVDGIILASVSISNLLVSRVKEAGIPCVLMNRGHQDRNVSTVTATNYEGAQSATEHLIETGCRNIAHIAGWHQALNSVERQRGFLKAMKLARLDPVEVIDCKFSRALAMRATRGLFKTGRLKPDAIFVGNDHMAFGVLEVLREELAIDVPNEVSVVGYDDVQMASWKMFDLTTVRQPINRMISTSIDLLLSKINGEIQSEKVHRIRSELIKRGTTRDQSHSDRFS